MALMTAQEYVAVSYTHLDVYKRQERAAVVLLPDQLQQPQLHRLLGGTLLPQSAAEEIAEGVRPLPALEVFLPSGPGDGGGMEVESLRQCHHGHGDQLCGLAGKKGPLGLQDRLRALAEGAAPALQAVQQPLGLLHLLLEIGPGLRLVGFLQKPHIVLADGHPGKVVIVQDHLELSVQFRDEQIRPDIECGLRRLEGAAGAGIQGRDPLFRRPDLLWRGMEFPGNEAVMLLAQVRQEAADDLHIQGGGKMCIRDRSVALARAGVETWHAGLIGPEGHFLKETLDRAGVHTRFVEESAGSTGHAIIQVDSTGQNSILLHDGANGRLTPDFVTAVLDQFSAGDKMCIRDRFRSISA